MRWLEIDSKHFWVAALLEYEQIGSRIVIFEKVMSHIDDNRQVLLFDSHFNRWSRFYKSKIKGRLLNARGFDVRYPRDLGGSELFLEKICKRALGLYLKPDFDVGQIFESEVLKSDFHNKTIDSETIDDRYFYENSNLGTRAYDPSSGAHNVNIIDFYGK